jgi:tellurite resistance protein TehA-like permease
VNKKKKKLAVTSFISGIILIAIGLILSETGLFKAYGLASSPTSCPAVTCSKSINQVSSIVRIGDVMTYVGYALVIIGLIVLIVMSLKKQIEHQK